MCTFGAHKHSTEHSTEHSAKCRTKHSNRSRAFAAISLYASGRIKHFNCSADYKKEVSTADTEGHSAGLRCSVTSRKRASSVLEAGGAWVERKTSKKSFPLFPRTAGLMKFSARLSGHLNIYWGSIPKAETVRGTPRLLEPWRWSASLS